MPTYEVTVAFAFTARHAARLPDGTLEPSHAHAWRVTATYRAERLDDRGFVVDFLAVRGALETLGRRLSGADLNAAIPPASTGASAERVAEYLAAELARKVGKVPYCLRVREASDCTAACYPAGAE